MKKYIIPLIIIFIIIMIAVLLMKSQPQGGYTVTHKEKSGTCEQCQPNKSNTPIAVH